MSVVSILDKITERNTDIVGCIAIKEDRMYHNLEAFDMDCDKIAETVGDLMAVSDLLEVMDDQVNTVLTEYDGNCLVGQRVDENIVIAVTDHLHRGAYKKLQVGLSLQGRLLTKALDEAASLPPDVIPTPVAEAPAEPTKPAAPEAPKSRWSKLVGAVVATAPDAPEPAAEDPANAGKTKKFYRGQVYYE